MNAAVHPPTPLERLLRQGDCSCSGTTMTRETTTSTPNAGRCPYEVERARCAFRAEHEGSHLMVERQGDRAWVVGQEPLPQEEWVFHQEASVSGAEGARDQSQTILSDVWGPYWNEARVRAYVREQREGAGLGLPAPGHQKQHGPRTIPSRRRRDRRVKPAAPRPGTRGSSRRKAGRA
jgi:hypothetical protein